MFESRLDDLSTVMGIDTNLSTTLDGIKRICQKVEQDLLKHLSIGLDHAPIWEWDYDNLLIFEAGLPLHKRYRVQHHVIDIHHVEGGLALPREIE